MSAALTIPRYDTDTLGYGEHRHLTFAPGHAVPLISPVPRILLLENDLEFNFAFKKCAIHNHVPAAVFQTFADFDLSRSVDYDLVIADQNLGTLSGIEFAKYVEENIGDIPVLIMLDGENDLIESDNSLPSVVQGFTKKDAGPESVLNDAIAAFVTTKHRAKKLTLIEEIWR